MAVNSVAKDKVGHLKSLILEHPCANHEWFKLMEETQIRPEKLVRFLINYDVHATLLRRLLLKAACIMPEPAVGYILENVRTEYGSGDYKKAHQLQLLDLLKTLAIKFNIQVEGEVKKVSEGVRQYLNEIPAFYIPDEESTDGVNTFEAQAISAGAIGATELLAMKEFSSMKRAFDVYSLGDHIWFDHVRHEKEHAEDSFDLIKYFLQLDESNTESIELGIGGVLMCNTSLYDGFLEALS